MYKYSLVFLNFVFLLLAFGRTQLLNCTKNDECQLDGVCLKKGEGYTPKDECRLFECLGEYGITTGITTNSWCEDHSNLPPGCTVLPEKLGKPYPECCSRALCPPAYSSFTGEGTNCDVKGNNCFHDGKCYAKNEIYQHKDYCIELTCRGFNQTTKRTCAIPSVAAGCQIIERSPGNYPECCPKVVC